MRDEFKLRILLFFFGAIFLFVWGRLFYWQVLLSGNLSAEAEYQHFSVLNLPANRGEIDFSDKTPIVANKNASLLYADLRKVPSGKDNVALAIAPILAAEIPIVATNSAVITPEEMAIIRDDNEKQTIRTEN